MHVELNHCSIAVRYLQRELAMPIATKWGFPFQASLTHWPHVEFTNSRTSPDSMRMFASTPFWSYGPEDLAVLEDSLKLQRYVEVYTDAIAPSLRAFADLAIRKQHLCDFPDNKVMAKVFILSGLDWSTVDNGANQLINYAVYADAWAPLLKRFAAGKFNRQDAPCGIKRENCLTGMGVAGNFEVLQPTMPCPLNYCVWALSIMLGEAGKLEAELQVCPSIEFS